LLEPILQRVAHDLRETAVLAKLLGRDVRPVLRVNPEFSWQSVVESYEILAPHASAAAKAIYAFQSQELITSRLSQPLAAFTTKTKVDVLEITQEYEEVRRLGYAQNNEEVGPDTSSIACPVRIAGMGVLYSVGVVGPSYRLSLLNKSEVISRLAVAASAVGSILSSGGSSGASDAPAWS
jgi:DNA-binding IclR family transcriptional regulator